MENATLFLLFFEFFSGKFEKNISYRFSNFFSKKDGLLLRPYAQTVLKVYAKVRKSAQFENFAFLCHKN